MSRRRYYSYSPNTSKSNAFYVGVKEVLDIYCQELQTKVDMAVDQASKDTVKRLKAANGKNDWKYYPKGWTRKKVKSDFNSGYVVYNKTHYQLTHLLENGHAVSNQFGSTQKRAAAYPHIRPAEQEGIREFEELIGL